MEVPKDTHSTNGPWVWIRWVHMSRHISEKSTKRLERCLEGLRELPIGGTAVGTGINTHPRFAREVCRDLNRTLKERFFEAKNHFEAQSAKDACVETSGQLKTLAVSLTKIANDLRWLSCGPRAGLQEILLPEVQPGSSIMPGKVNPVIAESLLQVAAQVIGNDTTVTLAGQAGNFELNVYKPVLIYNLLQSIRLIADVCDSFSNNCIDGIEINEKVINAHLNNSLMLVTALNPHIGYDNSAKVAKKAYDENMTLRDSAMALNLLSGEEFDKIVKPQEMTRSKK